MKGKTVVVTGASSGIGQAAAVQLAQLGAEVVPVGRDAGRLAQTANRIRDVNPVATTQPLRADFASLEEVRRLAGELLERHPHIDVLVNNAGLVSGRRALTVDGNETTLAVNHLAPFLLTNLLIDRLRSSSARIVTTSSDAHRSALLDIDDLQGERQWSSWRAYSNSKLANVLFTRALARRMQGSGVSANSLHPGVIRTRLGRNAGGLFGIGWRLAGLFFRSSRRGAATIVHLSTQEDGVRVSGGYFADCRPATPSLQAQDDELGERLWQASERLTGLG
jgi:retinol dehydrogenase 12